MAIFANASNLSTAGGDNDYHHNNYVRDGGYHSPQHAANGYQGRSYQSFQSNRQFHGSYSDNDESESSESSYDSVDSIISTESSSSNYSASSSGSGSDHRGLKRQAKNSDGSFAHSYKKPSMPLRNLYIAMDCEMVATEKGRECARVVLVDWKGRTLLDTHVKPQYPVTDYLTFVSGIVASNLTDAPDFQTVQAQVKQILGGKILVGHALENDLASLHLDHPWWMIRDTAYYQPFMQVRRSGGESFYVPRKLKDLCEQRLKKQIQVLGVAHCPYEDAKAALDLYKSHRPRWESCVTSQIHHQRKMARHQMQQAYYASMMSMPPISSIAY